jgi:hypothetical protein
MQSSRFRSHIVYLLYGIGATLAILLTVFSIKILLFSGKKDAEETETNHDSLPLELTSDPFPLTQPDDTFVPTQKVSLSKRILAIVSALVLVALIAVTFFFSLRYYSAKLRMGGNMPGSAQAPIQHAPLVRPEFERGIIYPQWVHNGYGDQDTIWQQDVGTIKTQTQAQWIEIPVLFSQATFSSTVVEVVPSTPGLQGFIGGIKRAHVLGYKVFFVPLMQVRQVGGWSGSITFNTKQKEQEWFDSYWQTIQPYVIAAANEHVEQMAIATELQTLQQAVPDALWNQLIARIQSIFKNTLTYDMNWSSLAMTLPTWLKNPGLTYVGVSTYIPLLDKAERIDPKDMPALWQQKIKTQLDAFSTQLGKQVLITEIGYRNSSDALYRTWESYSNAQPDPVEQAGAYNAVLTNVLTDTHIGGTFFWGWDDVGMFSIAGQPAVQVLQKWYTLTQQRA